MEAISTPVSSSIGVCVPSKAHHHLIKPPLLLLPLHVSTTTATTTTSRGKTSWISNKTTYRHKLSQVLPSATSQPTPSPTQNAAATGYAAALIDAALCSNSLDAVHKDVKRLLKWLQMTDPSMEESVKGRVVKELSKKAKLQRQVITMVKMLVSKNKSGMLLQVMEEFQRIYLQLVCSCSVVVN